MRCHGTGNTKGCDQPLNLVGRGPWAAGLVETSLVETSLVETNLVETSLVEQLILVETSRVRPRERQGGLWGRQGGPLRKIKGAPGHPRSEGVKKHGIRSTFERS